MVLGWRRHEGGMKMRIRGLLLLSLMVTSVLVGGSSLIVTTADAETCPNETLRAELGSSGLPDCRAYEMVSPPYKEGYPLFAFSYSADGEKAIVGGLGDLAGAPGAGEAALEGDLYMDTRTVSGWQLAPLNAPLTQFVGQVPLAYEANSGETLWKLHKPSQSSTTRELYARSASGVYRRIGPLDVPFAGEVEEEDNYISLQGSHYNGPFAATSNFGHIILDAVRPENYWPFDKTNGSGSLYEYSGVDNSQPILVGVEGEKGSTRLLSPCGTLLGSTPEGGNYNALSANGESVFFTAVGCEGRPAEVYARLHGALVSPVAAETVDVSGSECSGVCGPASGKNFEGASEDGHVVFFTSTQQLTGSAVDGTASGDAAEGSGCAGTSEGAGGCNLYAYDFSLSGAACQVERKCLRLIAGGEVLGVAGMAEDGQRIYYIKREVGNQPDLYVYDLATGQTKLVAALSYTGGVGEEKIWTREFRHPVEVSGEGGRFMVFVSSTPRLTADDEASVPQLFEYDAVTGELVRISKGEDGYNNNGNNAIPGINPEAIYGFAKVLGFNGDFKSGTDRLNVSFDGRTVVFKTSGRLSRFASSAEHSCFSIYEFRTGGLLREGSVRLLSDGVDVQAQHASCGAGFEGMSGDGDDVLFSTADPLLSGDVDGVQRDIYDARVEGGFPVVRGGVCSVECGVPGGSVAPGVVPVGGGSLTQSPEALVGVPAAGEPKVKAKRERKVVECSKGKRLEHGRCVGVRSKKIARKAKRASREWRGK